MSYFVADGELYAGTVADFSATDSLIIKNKLRTEQYDLKHLNEPHFVNSLEDEHHVYFFFRESAVEFMNCGKVRMIDNPVGQRPFHGSIKKPQLSHHYGKKNNFRKDVFKKRLLIMN